MRNSIKKGINVGWLIERCRFCIRERAFSEKWMELNKQYPSWRDDILQQIFNRSSDTFRVQRARLRVTARERFIVATVIQWLGTNVGFAWLQDVLELIGYKIVPNDEERKRYYYHPFQDVRDASAWNNINAKNNRNDVETIAPRIVKLQTKRKHLIHTFRNGRYLQICIRCGYEPVPYSSKAQPDCIANYQILEKVK